MRVCVFRKEERKENNVAYALRSAGCRNKSRGHETAYLSISGVPNRCESKKLRSVALLYCFDIDDPSCPLENDGRSGRIGPEGKANRRWPRAGSCCAAVPSEARNSARFRSCSRIMDDRPEILLKRDSLRRSISLIRASPNSPLRIRK